MTTSARTLPPCRAGANRSCRSASGPAFSWPSSRRGTHSRSQPGPATPTRRSMPSSAGLERGRHGVGVGVQRAGHDERAVQARVGPAFPGGVLRRRGVVEAGPHLDPRELPVAAHRLCEGAQQIVDGAAAAGVLGEVGEQLVGRAAHRVHRGAGPAGGPASERTGAGRRGHDRGHGGPDDPALGARRQPAEQEQQRDQPEEDRRADRRDRSGGDEHAGARPSGLRLHPAAIPATTARPANTATAPGTELRRGTRSRCRARRSRRRPGARPPAGPGARAGRADR